METPQQMMEAAKLRLRLQMHPRLRLEVLAALSRVFREYRDPVTDDLLSQLILAVPDELVGEAHIDHGLHNSPMSGAQRPKDPPPGAQRPKDPPPGAPRPKDPPPGTQRPPDPPPGTQRPPDPPPGTQRPPDPPPGTLRPPVTDNRPTPPQPKRPKKRPSRRTK